MLLEFRLRNFRSYAAEKRFSMVAGSGKELSSNTMTVEGFERHPLLRCAAIYGANASGKSNLIHAFGFLRSFVLQSSVSRPEGERIPVTPFLLDPALAREPSEFEITFLLDGVRHQYGFIVSPERVHEEWLLVYPKGKPQEWFHRTGGADGKQDWSWSRPHLRGDKRQLADRTRDDALFLSVAAQWNHPQIRPIYRWFRNGLRVLPRGLGINSETRRQLLNDPVFRQWLTDVLRSADVGISRVIAEESSIGPEHPPFASERLPEMGEYLAEGYPRDLNVEVRTTHRLPGSNREIEWELDKESDGTQRMFELLGPIYNVLKDGAVLVMDELDTSLHAHVTCELVRLFDDPATNPNRAQLIFTTHDTSLLDPTVLRRDQIWFTSKDQTGATDLYSLQDFSPRKGEPFQKGYLAGRYGAVPILGRFEFPPAPRTSAELEPIASEG